MRLPAEYQTNERYGFRSLWEPLRLWTLLTFEMAGGSAKVIASMEASTVDVLHVSKRMLEKHLIKQLKEELALFNGILETG